MCAEKEDGSIIIKNFLGTVTMMNIKVDNADPLYSPFFLNIAGCNCHIVEVAKAHGLIALGVVAGRSHGTKGVVEFTVHHPAGHVQHATDRRGADRLDLVQGIECIFTPGIGSDLIGKILGSRRRTTFNQ